MEMRFDGDWFRMFVISELAGWWLPQLRKVQIEDTHL